MTLAAKPEGLAPRRICVLEHNQDGHRLFYVRLLVEAATKLGDHVTVETSDAAVSSDEWGIHMAGIPHVEISRTPRPRSILDAYRIVKRLRGQFDHLVIPDGDRLALVLAVMWGRRLGSTALLAMRLPASTNWKGRLKGYVLGRAAAHERNSVFLLAMPGEDFSVPRRVRLLIDPVHVPLVRSRAAAPDLELLDSEVFWIGLLGRITARKNAPLLLSALRSRAAATSGPKLGACVAGKIDPEIKEWMEAQDFGDLRVVVIDRYLSDEEMHYLVSRQSSIALTYDNDGPSGLLCQAAMAGVPVLVAGSTRLCRVVQQWNLGVAASALTEAELRTSVESLVGAQRPWAITAEQRKFTRCLEQAVEDFGATLLSPQDALARG